MPKRPSADLPELAERLIEVRQRFELNQRDFAKRLGVSWRALQDYEQGRAVPGGNVLAEYAELGVDLSWLLTGEKISIRRSQPGSIWHVPQLEGLGGHEEASHGGLIPVRDFMAGDQSGAPLMMLHQDILKHLSPAASGPGAPLSDSLAIVRMPDDSMAPTLGNGSLIVIDCSSNRVDEDGLYVLDVDDRRTIRRFQRQGEEAVLLRCDNPQWSVELFQQQDLRDIRIVGRVLIKLISVK